MRTLINKFFVITFLLFLFNCKTIAQQEKVLVFSKTQSYRHESIPAGIAAIKNLGIAHNFKVSNTEDASLFNVDTLKKYKAIIFLSTSGDILDSLQQLAFESYIKSGGGYVGIHAASDTEYEWPWYGRLVGSYFKSHPAIQPAIIKVADHVHPSTAHLPTIWSRRDEWYDYKENPRGKIHVLATLDENSYQGGTMGFDHPIAWCHEFDGGRSWYTGGGHTVDSYSEKEFLEHILGGILYAAGKTPGVFDATINTNYDISIVDPSPMDPLALEVLPDLSILYIERAGAIKLIDQATGKVEVAGKIKVSNTFEDGMLGVTLDPNFKENNWIYLFYSPEGKTPEQRLSRYTLTNKKIDFASEKLLLTIPTQREECCHSGGALEFDSKGNLYISIGDNTNPFTSNGFTPIDERAGKKYWDAQRTAANSKDFRGKILKIKPTLDGTYTIPPGNLFSDTAIGLPEIYIMGCRNPYRIAIDKKTDVLYWGEVGPDAEQNLAIRGPKGYDEINRAEAPGNYGWPYCTGNNYSYVDFDFATLTSGDNFDCASPQNMSPNNTGIKSLPESKPAWIWYPYSASPEFPDLGIGQRTAMVGAIYHYDSTNSSEIKFPAYFTNKVIIYEWARDKFFEVIPSENNEVVKINRLFSNYKFSKPIDMTFGPDGAMYVAQWGTGFWGGNPDAKIIKISFVQNGRSPISVIEASKTSGPVPLTVNFSGNKSSDPDPLNKNLSFSWDVNADGIPESMANTFNYTFTTKGVYQVVLKVTDSDGKFSFSNKMITVGNSIPAVTNIWPPDGGIYEWGDTIPFKIKVDDLEDGTTVNGTIACTDISAAGSIGHDTHAHNTSEINNCAGQFPTISHGEGTDNVFYVFNSNYRDNGVKENIQLTGSAQSILRPKRIQARHYNGIGGAVLLKPDTISPEGPYIGNFTKNNFLYFNPINFFNIDFITFRAGASKPTGFIELRLDSVKAAVIAKIRIASLNKKSDLYSLELPAISGTHALYLTLADTTKITNLNWIEFFGKGISKENMQPNAGLLATYTNINSADILRRKEPMIAFNWEKKYPSLAKDSNNFTVEWSGNLTPTENGMYEFQTEHENGSISLYVNADLIINNTVGIQSNSAKINLLQNKKYSLRLTYKHQSGNAQVFLKWKTPSSPTFNVIHTKYLTLPDGITGIDCNGDIDGKAEKDSCGNCAGGRTAIVFETKVNNCVTGLDEKFINEVMFVNPVSNKKFIFSTTKTSGNYNIVASNGAVVKQGVFVSGINEVECKDCLEGLYLIRLTTQHGNVISKKIILLE